ncbi:hypothetical protein B0H63DRAFT_463357 [Podospora didyma]|uniref:Uncharacterized protein n=1 Tax=Podospora didyma TaxID=330526 RepID=A0AAE0U367_9PEZI|nr:hypothetical protein B0H63DRAFT_463357 [Podospora didyma]
MHERRERHERNDKHNRHNRHERHERHDRHNKLDRPEKPQDSKRPPQTVDRYRPGNDNPSKNTPSRKDRKQERRAVDNDEQPKATKRRSSVTDGKEDEAEGEDYQHVFAETKPPRAGDPVGIPLGCQYNDDATIPPKFDAKCLQSKFFNKENRKEFAMSIRDSDYWHEARDDPVFRHYVGMTMRRFSGCEHHYSVLDPAARPPSPVSIKMPPRYRIDRVVREVTPKRELPYGTPTSLRNTHGRHLSPRVSSSRNSPLSRHNGDGGESRRFPKRSLEHTPEEHQLDEHDAKRAKTSVDKQQEVRPDNQDANDSPIADGPGSPLPDNESPAIRLEGNPWFPQPGETAIEAPSDRYLEVHYDSKPSSCREERALYSKMRHDSGYHSGQSQDKASHRDVDRGRGDRPPVQRPRSPSRSRSGSRGRMHRRRSPSHSRSDSRTPSDQRSYRSRSDSPLTAIEAGLLGLTDEDESKLKLKKKKPIRKVKVAAAFSRRW